jgi:hypothetical protein
MGTVNANVILSDGFENGVSAWYVEGSQGVNVVANPVYEGSKALALTTFDGGAASMQRRFSNETAQQVEVAMWVYIPASSANDRSLEIELRDPAQTDETPGAYVLFKEGAGLGVFSNYGWWGADFTKVADVVADQWTKLVIQTDVASKKITIEYNGTTYDNNGQGYGWATQTLNNLGKIKIWGPSTGSNVACYVDGLTVTQVPEPVTIGLLMMGGLGLWARKRIA